MSSPAMHRAASPADASHRIARSDAIAAARAAMAQHRPAQAVAVLTPLRADDPADADIAWLIGIALRDDQRMAAADAVFTAATLACPADARLSAALAQIRFDRGLPAAAHFAAARTSDPADPDLVRLHAAALAAEGEVRAAADLLTARLAADPAWVEGHRALATLRWTWGEGTVPMASLATATQAQPRNPDLWRTWLQLTIQHRDWTAARGVIDGAVAALGDGPTWIAARALIASESGAHDAAAAIDAAAGIAGAAMDLTRVRHAIRTGALDLASRIALPHLITASARLFWPYLSILWRMLGDPRADWLDRPETVRAVSIGLSQDELGELADRLRVLHTAARAYVDQSVRGGTQTDRSVLLRHEPIIGRARSAMLQAIDDYIVALPPHEQGHPLLGCPRGERRIEGSWSVRLTAQGRNVPHTHPMGWISTAAYIALPDPARMGAAPAGHIAFGTPPEDLGVDLPPTRTIAPQAGQIALFPSTTWHATVPFDDGERLVIAFDLAVPRW